jgi:predicted transport protein
MSENIELWTYSLYENGILDVNIEGSSQVDNKKGKRITKKEYAKYDLNYHLNKISKELQQKFNEIRGKILELPNIQEKPEQKSGVTYRTTKSFCRFEFRKNSINLLLREPKYNDPKQLVKDITSFEWGYKGLVKIDKLSDVDYIFSLIKQSYKDTL